MLICDPAGPPNETGREDSVRYRYSTKPQTFGTVGEPQEVGRAGILAHIRNLLDLLLRPNSTKLYMRPTSCKNAQCKKQEFYIGAY